jgi:SET domain-containing protein
MWLFSQCMIMQGVSLFVKPGEGFNEGELISPYFGELRATQEDTNCYSALSGIEGIIVDATDAWKARVSRFANDCGKGQRPNAELKSACDHCIGRQLVNFIVALRAIHGGEEVVIDYEWSSPPPPWRE